MFNYEIKSVHEQRKKYIKETDNLIYRARLGLCEPIFVYLGFFFLLDCNLLRQNASVWARIWFVNVHVCICV